SAENLPQQAVSKARGQPVQNQCCGLKSEGGNPVPVRFRPPAPFSGMTRHQETLPAAIAGVARQWENPSTALRRAAKGKPVTGLLSGSICPASGARGGARYHSLGG